MSGDGDQRHAELVAREAAEADLVSARLVLLAKTPIQGNYDLDHLKAIHAFIFQDLPGLHPGETRPDTERWSKTRALEGAPGVYEVHYAAEAVEARLTGILDRFGGADAIRGLPSDEAAGKLAWLYGALDHAHPFYEGNSRTLREFFRELADDAGFNLDWGTTSAGARERNALYIARDVAVLERAFPGLTPEKGMESNDQAEYEASLVLPMLQARRGLTDLGAIIRQGLTEQRQPEAALDGLEPER